MNETFPFVCKVLKLCSSPVQEMLHAIFIGALFMQFHQGGRAILMLSMEQCQCLICIDFLDLRRTVGMDAFEGQPTLIPKFVIIQCGSCSISTMTLFSII